jgi:transposase
MTLVWVDETGLRLLPALVRTWAPRGQTPILRTPLSREHLSVIGALTPTGRLFTRTYEHAIRGPHVVRFLKHLLAHLPGQLMVLWDGASIHRGHVVKDFLTTAAGQRLHLVALPGYAPDLNPAEGVWHLLKRR